MMALLLTADGSGLQRVGRGLSFTGTALAAAIPWSPADISSVTAWWDASDSSTVTYSSGTSVSSWASRVGGYALTQSTASKQPSRSGTVNGLSTVVFDGSNDGMLVNNFDMTAGGQTFTAWIVATAADNTSDMVFAEHTSNYNNTNGAFIFYRSANKKVQVGKRGGGGLSTWQTSSNLTTLPTLAIATHDGTQSIDESKIFMNGTFEGAPYPGYNSDTASNSLNATLYVGSRGDSGLYFNGQICEIGFCASTLSASTRQKLEGYLAHKWGMATNLPSDHPYKYSAPTSGAFSVTSEALSLWLDAADESSVTLANNRVSQWSDKSGNSRNAVQSTAAQQPSYGTSFLNGNKTLVFAGSQSLTLPAQTYSNYGRFIVVNPGTSNSYILYDTECSLITQYNSRPFELFRNGGNRFTISTNATTPSIIYIQKSGLTVSAYFNGVDVGSTYTATSLYPETMLIGVSNMGDAFTGNIAEVIALDSVVPTSTRQRIEGYLAHKWGLATSLPAGHPYKISAP